MFFWMVLASLTGILMFGNLHEKNKSQETFVSPTYQAVALSMYQQHLAAKDAYVDKIQGGGTVSGSGMTPLIVSENGSMQSFDGTAVQNRLPPYYKPQNGTRSYLVCVSKATQNGVDCSQSDAVKYVMTVREMSQRYGGTGKTITLKEIAKGTANSRSVGILQEGNALVAGANTFYQPVGSKFFILSGGSAEIDNVYIPSYAVGNFPLASGTLCDAWRAGKKDYLVALSLIGGLSKRENLTAGSDFCP